MSRIYMNSFDDWGCGYYRAKTPVYNCYSDLSKLGINIYLDKELHSDEDVYDAYILHRIPVESGLFFMQSMQKQGKKFVLEIDDDIVNIPDFMPSPEYKLNKWAFTRSLEVADEIWAATDTLAKALGQSHKTKVLPNLVDFNIFPLPSPPQDKPIHILWMGSPWHDKDLEQLVNPVLRLIEEYGNKVRFLFWGCLPTAFADYTRIIGENYAILTQKNFDNKILYLEGIPFKFYFDRIVRVRPYIGLAPLYDCTFNDSKTNLKYLEYTMAGAATVATNMPPYQCIENGKDGLLVEPHDEEGWYKAIKTLIEDRKMRDEIVNNARDKVYEQFSWQSQSRKEEWLNAFKELVK